MNHHHQPPVDARRTHYGHAHRTTRLAFATTVAAILLAHLFLFLALTTFKK
jgi:hypothetical protein